eukprot:CAMPEP_0119274500 /NCGR_PEP_ID=MMETSP1329-20130426/12227_1 /TAXON_ID=114041 /ORGANISM="Genus nov. species nov., Strain RCC1024" /LENGTH=33 /DNA_ID= /DNA_START= /DNA_END= /DNA_ORIENTATION=
MVSPANQAAFRLATGKRLVPGTGAWRLARLLHQ